jgi:large repetitive protein
VTVVAPSSGPTTGGTSVTITGINFTGATASSSAPSRGLVHRQRPDLDHCDLAGREWRRRLTVTTGGGTDCTGVIDVTVTIPCGAGAGGAADQFAYLAAPTVNAVPPRNGPAAGGISVTITGRSCRSMLVGRLCLRCPVGDSPFKPKVALTKTDQRGLL